MYLVWTPVTETPPPVDEMEVLAWDEKRKHFEWAIFRDGKFEDDEGNDITQYVTHWAEVTGPERQGK